MIPTICEQISSDLVAYLDGELSGEDRRPIVTHVSTCLACRRELDRLATVQRYVTGISRVSPGPEFSQRFWQRLEAEPAPAPATGRRGRPLVWALPALAAAAVLAVALPFMQSLPGAPVLPQPESRQQTTAHAPEMPKVKIAAQPARKQAAEEHASVDDLRLEDLPPALLEHPELFLRLPVVRRLETLENFEAVRQSHGSEDGAG